MNRRKFAHAWGRKMFFGLSWPITTILALIYFRSFIFPESAIGWVYYLLTTVGFFGLLHCVGYFVLYYPVVAAFPSYYLSRLWSLFIVSVLNVFVFLDGYVFSQYRFYLNKFAINVMSNKGSEALLGSGVVAFIAVLLLIGAISFWIQGNRIWQTMQRRFSVPTKNWYVVLIIACVIASQVILFKSTDKAVELRRVSMLFPQNLPYMIKGNVSPDAAKSASMSVLSGGSHVNYPVAPLTCFGRFNRNVFLFVVEGLNEQDISEFKTPMLYHALVHGMAYNDHYSGSSDGPNGLFSLLYGLPSTYMYSMLGDAKNSIFLSEFRKRKYEMSFHSTVGASNPVIPLIKANFEQEEIDLTSSNEDYWKNTLPALGEADLPVPVLSLNYYPVAPSERDAAILRADAQIQEAVMTILRRGYLKDSVIIITGAQGDLNYNAQLAVENSFRVPLLVIGPGRKSGTVDHMTSHYDVMPTVMQDYWGCKNPLVNSQGKLLSEVPKEPGFIVSHGSRFAVIDLEKKNISSLTENGSYELVDFYGQRISSELGRQELMLDALSELNSLYKSR
jgi:membrane-anchored protein YejM (alkaline phosphatase superfamily)